MFLIRLPLILVFALLLAAPCAAAPLAVRAGEDNDRMSVVYSDGACGKAARCDRAQMGCRAPGEFFLSVLNLPKPQVQAWLKADKGSATLRIDDRSFALTADSLDGMHGKTGLLDVAFFGGERQSEIWTALAPAKTVEISLGATRLTLAGEGVTVDLKALAGACTK